MSGGHKRWALAVSAAALLAGAGEVAAQAPPAEAQTQNNADDDNEIVVLAPENETRIDRRTYTIRDDPAAQSHDMLDTLGRIPSVSVAPSGAITLLGADNVTIQINGQPAPEGGLEEILRGLPASDVERIEVITNPSAQYDRQGTGGIINIITRQRTNGGYGGSIFAGADSQGGSSLSIGPSWTNEKWSVSGWLGANRGARTQDFERERVFPDTGLTSLERGPQDNDFRFVGGSAHATYSATPQRRATLTVDSMDINSIADQAIARSDDGAPISSQTLHTEYRNENHSLQFQYRQENPSRPREALTLSLLARHIWRSNDISVHLMPLSAPESAVDTLYRRDIDQISGKLDYERPYGERDFLTLGASFEHYGNGVETAQESVAGPPQISDFHATLGGSQETSAAYATYQWGADDWTVLPGVRLENFRQEVSSTSEIENKNFRAFPTLHLRRNFGAEVTLDLSYSSRIQRPGIGQLDTAVRLNDATHGYMGNPTLRPTTTGAYEANLTYQTGSTTYGVTFYDRINDDVWSQRIDQIGGLALTIPVNVGESDERGLQIIARAPLWAGWRYSVSANAQNREFDALSNGALVRRSELEYSGNAQLEYRDRDQNAVGADNIQFDLQFQGPRHQLQSEDEAFVSANFSWRRRLAPGFSSIVSVDDIFDSQDQRSELTTDDYFERTLYDNPGTSVRFTLAYQFGALAQQPLQDAPGPPAAPPAQ